MKYDFGKVEQINIPRSSFDLSHGHKTSYNGGWIVPILWMEILPGDTLSVKMHHLTRLSTPEFPLMDNMFLDSQAFFIPFRLISENTRKFYGEQDNPGDSIDYSWPIINSATATIDADPEGDLTTAAGRTSALLDYLGIPTGIDGADVDINSLVLRAYYDVYNHWYRDQNLQDSLVFNKDDGPDTDSDYELQKRGKRPDYFCSSLPWPQKGDAVQIPMTPSPVPVDGTGIPSFVSTTSPSGTVNMVGNSVNTDNDWSANATSSGTGSMQWSNPQLEVDLTSVTAATINDLRESFQVQKLLERDARNGTRFAEQLKNHFGVNFYDLSYRPAYLGGGSSRINITPIAQTATTNLGSAGVDVGHLGAYGTSSGGDHSFTSSFNEPGIVLMNISVRADLTYQQGLHKFFSKRTRYEMYYPSLAHLGEEAVLSKEIFCDGTAGDDDVWGYQERYADYRYLPSRISGLFRSAAVASLDPWHLSQEFVTRPLLGDSFIKEDPPIDRIIATPTEPHFISDFYFQIKAARPMPVFGTPGLIDHF